MRDAPWPWCAQRAGARRSQAIAGGVATAAEIHVVFLGPLGPCWWAFARWRASPAPRWVLLAGLGSGVAAALHFTGHFLAPSLVATAACLRATPWCTWLLHSFCLVFGHAAATAAMALRLFEQLQQPLLICASARTRWSLDPHEAVHSLWRRHVEANHDLEAVDRRGLHGWCLRPRPPR